MKKIAFIFPGQGAQYPGMGKDFFDAFPIARQTFEEADDLLSQGLSKTIFEGPEELLTQTRNSQLGIFVNSIAILRTLSQQIPAAVPAICSGLSLGEYTALCASKRATFADTLAVVRERARLMNEACEQVPGTMAAVLGLNGAQVEEALHKMTGIWVANYNAPGQIVISGTREGVEKASAALKEKGAKRVLPLEVHGAFHSGLMASAQEKLAPHIQQVSLHTSPVQLVMNVPGDFVTDLSQMKSYLIQQVTHSVRWEQGIRAIDAAGVHLYVEIGCGKTLQGLNRKIGVQAPTLSVDKVSDLEELVKQLDHLAKA